jgi:hypothetical protein
MHLLLLDKLVVPLLLSSGQRATDQLTASLPAEPLAPCLARSFSTSRRRSSSGSSGSRPHSRAAAAGALITRCLLCACAAGYVAELTHPRGLQLLPRMASTAALARPCSQQPAARSGRLAPGAALALVVTGEPAPCGVSSTVAMPRVWSKCDRQQVFQASTRWITCKSRRTGTTTRPSTGRNDSGASPVRRGPEPRSHVRGHAAGWREDNHSLRRPDVAALPRLRHLLQVGTRSSRHDPVRRSSTT